MGARRGRGEHGYAVLEKKVAAPVGAGGAPMGGGTWLHYAGEEGAPIGWHP